MSGVPGPSVQAVVIPDPSTIQNPSLKYAMMQLTTANNLRKEARTKMDEIANTQEAQRVGNSYLDDFRKRQTDATTSKSGQTIQQYQIDWCRNNNIKLPVRVERNNFKPMDLDANEWDLICKGTQSYIEGLGSNMQQKMVMAQDALGQYNSYVQGASSSVNSGLETSKYVNRGQ